MVEKLLGGKGGGGARLTEARENAIQTFYTLEKKVQDFVNTESMNLKF